MLFLFHLLFLHRLFFLLEGPGETDGVQYHFVTVEKFNEFQNVILEAIKGKQAETPAVPVVKEDVDATPSENPIPPAWRKVVDEVLGTDFGISISYPGDGTGFLFKIIVPKDKSNASKDYLEMYKIDVRTKAINNSEGIGGIRLYCEKVKKNLGLK